MEKRLSDLEERLEDEIRRINFVNNSKLDRAEVLKIKESFVEVLSDIREDVHLIRSKQSKFEQAERKRQITKLEKILIGLNILLLILTIIKL